MNIPVSFIFACNESGEMKSKNSKFSQRFLGKTLIEWVCSAVKEAGVDKLVLLEVQNTNQIIECLTGEEPEVLLICGDMPLIKSKTILEAANFHRENKNSITIISANTATEEFSAEEADFAAYFVSANHLLEAISKVKRCKNYEKYCFKDIPEMLIEKGLKVGLFDVKDPSELLRVNNRIQLSQATRTLKNRILEEIMNRGVTIIDPETTYIDGEVMIGMDTLIYPGTIIEGETFIGENCIIGPNSRIVSSNIGDEVEVVNSIVTESTIGDKSHVGPFSYIRPNSIIGENVKIGDFVEVKKSSIGDNTMISHLTYVGDAEIGRNVNLGCGVVVVNYDGENKHKTIVEDNAFIGCNVNLVSPVTVHKNAFVAAGSTITDEVPADSLAISRSRQIIKEGWVNRRKGK